MIKWFLLFFLTFFGITSYPQEIDIYLSPNDCMSCVAKMDQVFGYSIDAKMRVISDKPNAYLIKKMLIKYVPYLDSFNYEFIVDDSLYRANMKRTEYRSFISLLFKGDFLANFILKSFYTKGYNEKLDEILVSLKHPLLNHELKYPIYYPKITENGFYSINKALEKLEYYYEVDSVLSMKEISYAEIEELSLGSLYSGQRLRDVKEFTRLKNETDPRWGFLTLGPGGNVYGDTLMILYSFLHVADTSIYQKNVVSGIIWVYEGQIVNHRIAGNNEIYSLENWAGGAVTLKHKNDIIVKKYYEGMENTFENKYTSLARLTDSNNLDPLPVIFDTTLYSSYRCSPNSMSKFFLSGRYMANQRSILELVDLEKRRTFKISWDSAIIEKHYGKIKDSCMTFAVVGFISKSNSFHFLTLDETKGKAYFALLSNVNGETEYRYLSRLEAYDLGTIFGESLIIGLDRDNLRWHPVTLF